MLVHGTCLDRTERRRIFQIAAIEDAFDAIGLTKAFENQMETLVLRSSKGVARGPGKLSPLLQENSQ